VDRDERVAVHATSTGLKDVPAAAREVSIPPPIAPDLDAVARVLRPA